MNHPTPDQWMSFLYEEDGAQHRRELIAHLRGCAECAAKLNALRAGRSALDEWRLPQAHAVRPRSLLRWVAAAAVLLLAGVGIGRFSAGDARSMRVSMHQEIDARLAAARAETQQLLVDFIKDLDRKRDADSSAFLVAMREADARRAAEFARLRRDLDTVAVFADTRFSEAQDQLYQLANSTPSSQAVLGGDKSTQPNTP